jgi:hypothetical protein
MRQNSQGNSNPHLEPTKEMYFQRLAHKISVLHDLIEIFNQNDEVKLDPSSLVPLALCDYGQASEGKSHSAERFRLGIWLWIWRGRKEHQRDW